MATVEETVIPLPHPTRALIIDYDAIPHRDGSGPWIVLKGRLEPGPDPSSVNPMNVSLADLERNLSVLQFHELREAHRADARHPQTKPGLGVWIRVGLFVHREILSRPPDFEITIEADTDLADLSRSILSLVKRERSDDA